jgi:hypothetical protein
MHKLKFTLNEQGFGTVTLDGCEIDVAALTYTQRAGEPSTVTMTIFAQVDGEVEVKELTTADKGKLSDQPPEPHETPAPATRDVAPPRRPRLL